MLHLFWILMSYLLGAMPFGLLVAKIFCGVDPRQAGSRNIGATNVTRLCGLPYGIAALVLDLAKGFAPVAMAMTFSCSWVFLSFVGLAAIVGHMYSCFLSGGGGKGVATTIGVFLALAPVATILAVIACCLVIWAGGYVSLGSLTLTTALPIFLFLGGSWGIVPLALVVAVLVSWRHRENILRLARGEEKPWRSKK